MKPWITEAIGTQKVWAPSSVDQPDFATSPKFAIAARSVRSASWPLLKSSSAGVERPAGDEVARRAGVELGVQRGVVLGRRRGGRSSSLMPGCAASKAGMIVSCQIGEVVVAPALDRQRDVLGEGGAAGQQRAAEQEAFSGVSLIRWSLPVGGPVRPRFSGRRCSASSAGPRWPPLAASSASACGWSRAPAAISTAGFTAPAGRLERGAGGARRRRRTMAATMRAARSRSLALSATTLTM